MLVSIIFQISDALAVYFDII